MSDRTSSEIIDREYLEMRAKVLELAASFDRIARATGEPDQRMQKIADGIALLQDDQGEKAKRVQLLFSRVYEEGWQDEFGMRSAKD